jgi:hypothetical protein
MIVGSEEMTLARLPRPEDIAAAGRLVDVLAAAELHGRPLPVTRQDRALSDRIRIVYLVAGVGRDAWEELLLAQATELAALGADVTVLARVRPNRSSEPRSSTELREQRSGPRARLRRVPYGEALTDAVPPCDLIVAGSWELVLPARMLGFAPVVLFEQGELQVLGDVPPHIHEVVAASLRAAMVTFARGEEVRSSLSLDYGVEAREVPDLARELLAQYGDVVRSCALAPPLGDFTVRLGGLRFARPGAAARLRARLGACTTHEVALPISQPVLGQYRAVRWRVVAHRDGGEEGTTRVYLPARSDRPLEDAPQQEGLELLRAGRADEALAGFSASCQQGTRADQAVLGRWVVLAMLGAGRADDACEVAVAFARDFPIQPDYILLAVRCARAARYPVELSGLLRRMRLLGAGARYDEWFEDPYALLKESLGASA